MYVSHFHSFFFTANISQSLAYEVAPFNIKLSIIQPSLEINVLTNKLTTVPELSQYAPPSHKAPLARGIFKRLTSHLPPSPTTDEKDSMGASSMYPQLPEEMAHALTAETIHALTSIGGTSNPPIRLIVGYEGVASVKEKLRTVSEELEDFIEVSEQVDVSRGLGVLEEDKAEQHDD
jgi:hypothetical protein